VGPGGAAGSGALGTGGPWSGGRGAVGPGGGRGSAGGRAVGPRGGASAAGPVGPWPHGAPSVPMPPMVPIYIYIYIYIYINGSPPLLGLPFWYFGPRATIFQHVIWRLPRVILLGRSQFLIKNPNVAAGPKKLFTLVELQTITSRTCDMQNAPSLIFQRPPDDLCIQSNPAAEALQGVDIMPTYSS